MKSIKHDRYRDSYDNLRGSPLCSECGVSSWGDKRERERDRERERERGGCESGRLPLWKGTVGPSGVTARALENELGARRAGGGYNPPPAPSPLIRPSLHYSAPLLFGLHRENLRSSASKVPAAVRKRRTKKKKKKNEERRKKNERPASSDVLRRARCRTWRRAAGGGRLSRAAGARSGG
jgi:hypothetical protein